MLTFFWKNWELVRGGFVRYASSAGYAFFLYFLCILIHFPLFSVRVASVLRVRREMRREATVRHLCQMGESINLFVPSKAIKSNRIYNIVIMSTESNRSRWDETRKAVNWQTENVNTSGNVKKKKKNMKRMGRKWKMSIKRSNVGDSMMNIRTLNSFSVESLGRSFKAMFVIQLLLILFRSVSNEINAN